MTTGNWQLQKPLEAIVFDCDGTLSSIEGIDELAKQKHMGAQVEALTAEAMGKTGINPNLYKSRLDLVRPTREEVTAIGMEYFVHRIPHLEDILACFRRLNKNIYIISAGLYPAVKIFGNLLQIPDANIFAVNIDFDEQGQFLDFDHHCPLVNKDGKRRIATEIMTRHPRIAYVGDGLNDYVVHDLVTRFIGFGGAYYRENIAEMCEFYIKNLSLAAVLTLCLTGMEAQGLLGDEKVVYERGVRGIEGGEVIVRG